MINAEYKIAGLRFRGMACLSPLIYIKILAFS